MFQLFFFFFLIIYRELRHVYKIQGRLQLSNLMMTIILFLRVFFFSIIDEILGGGRDVLDDWRSFFVFLELIENVGIFLFFCEVP